jgi:hypothetical protein
MSNYGFIILRHVNSKITNSYWVFCYKSIRKYYPENNILIIDDNSNYDFITQQDLYKTTIIQSEYPGRGELLPYYYYLQNSELFDIAVIIHDSVFINSYIDFSEVDKYKLIWEFSLHKDNDQIEDETKMINVFQDSDLLKFYENKKLWKGCFGGMSIIRYSFLEHINNKYNISKLLDLVVSRYNRCSFERVIGCLFQKEYPKETLLGNIFGYCEWGITINEIYIVTDLPIIKIWTGR